MQDSMNIIETEGFEKKMARKIEQVSQLWIFDVFLLTEWNENSILCCTILLGNKTIYDKTNNGLNGICRDEKIWELIEFSNCSVSSTFKAIFSENENQWQDSVPQMLIRCFTLIFINKIDQRFYGELFWKLPKSHTCKVFSKFKTNFFSKAHHKLIPIRLERFQAKPKSR